MPDLVPAGTTDNNSMMKAARKFRALSPAKKQQLNVRKETAQRITAKGGVPTQQRLNAVAGKASEARAATAAVQVKKEAFRSLAPEAKQALIDRKALAARVVAKGGVPTQARLNAIEAKTKAAKAAKSKP